ncbi:hypothetical protein I7I51_05335 [Histoplasma capsulatum]|uniref:Rhodopsin domain-containing protein n=1 Tax=Ajellomyces capsulatus TaxID=5037 RepID=A0A8A1M4J1_AJECA|nr:hypothetical protein I7I51_05335 [Histoplasma capsulatum]
MAPGRHVQALVMIIIFPAISLVLVSLRILSRFLSKNWGWDDVFVVIAMILSIGMCVTSWGYTKYASQGFPPTYFPPDSFRFSVLGKQYNLANQLLYFPILTFVRASIITFILRLHGLRKFVIQSLRILFVINFCVGIAIFFADLFQCTPLRYAWDSEELDRKAQEAAGADENGMKNGKLIRGGGCIKGKAFFISMALLSIALDCCLLTIPSAIVWGINMPRRQKFMVVGVLSIGVVVTIFAIIRLILVSGNFDLPTLERAYDIEYTFSNIETNGAIWAAAVPALKSLIARLSPRLWQTATAPSLPYPVSSKLPPASSFPSLIPPIAGSENGYRAPFSTDAHSYPLSSLPPLRRINNSEAEIRRFEYDSKVSSLFRSGHNYIPDGLSSEGAMSVHSGSSNRQTPSDPTLAPRRENEKRFLLSPSATPTGPVQSAGSSCAHPRAVEGNERPLERGD